LDGFDGSSINFSGIEGIDSKLKCKMVKKDVGGKGNEIKIKYNDKKNLEIETRRNKK